MYSKFPLQELPLEIRLKYTPFKNTPEEIEIFCTFLFVWFWGKVLYFFFPWKWNFRSFKFCLEGRRFEEWGYFSRIFYFSRVAFGRRFFRIFYYLFFPPGGSSIIFSVGEIFCWHFYSGFSNFRGGVVGCKIFEVFFVKAGIFYLQGGRVFCLFGGDFQLFAGGKFHFFKNS